MLNQVVSKALTRPDIPTRVWVPEPVGFLVEELTDKFGPNLNVSPTPDTTDLLVKRAAYATRSTSRESTHPEHAVVQPWWYWKTRLREPAVA